MDSQNAPGTARTGEPSRENPTPRHDEALPGSDTGTGPEDGASAGNRHGNSTAEHAARYIAKGLALCAIPPGKKFPTLDEWQHKPRPASHWAATPADGMGAIMGLSGFASLDLDALPECRVLFADLGIDLDALIADAWIVRGNPARLRAEFRAPLGLSLTLHKLAWPPRDRSKPKDHPDGKPVTVFELRAGPVQDVLPPTIHPETRRPYEWVRGPDDGSLGELPAALLELWENWEAWAPVLREMCPWAEPVEPPKPRQRTAGDNPSVIGAFNQAHDVRALLESHGYRARGKKRWLAPSSDSKLPGVVLLPAGRVFSHHGADPLATGHALDAFEIFNLLAHGGDTRAAVKAAAELLGLNPAKADSAGTRPDGPPPREDCDPGPGADDYRGTDTSDPQPDTGPAPWPDPTPLPARGATAEAAPFPLALLPAPIQTAAREVARFVQAPEAAPALVGLATLATAIGKRAMVEERPGLTHYPALFFVGIAVSGERKSPVFRAMTRPLEDWTADQGPEWEEATRKAKARNTAVDAALTDAKSKAKKGGIDAAERAIAELEAQRLTPPPAPRLFTSDATEQRLFQMMHDRGGAFAVLSGEGRPVVDAIAGKYSGDKRTGDAIYLAGISGDTITRDRVGGEGGPEDRVIRTPCLNVCILVQPDKYLEAATHPALRASGALARIWPVWLPSMVGRRFEEAGEVGLDRGAMDPYAAMVKRLLNHKPPQDDHGRPAPHLVTLSPAAAEGRRLYHNAVEGLQGADMDLADCREIASKATTQTVKLALVLHLAARPEALDNAGSMIDGETWRTAEAIGAWFLAEAVRVQRQADEDPALDAARRVLRWLATERRETLSGRDLQQSAPRPRPNAKEAAAVLDLLADHGYVREETPPGARKPAYRVRPALSVATVANVAKGTA